MDTMQHRYYDAVTGQFLSFDPLLSQTQQAYVYAADNPAENTDMTGENKALGRCPVFQYGAWCAVYWISARGGWTATFCYFQSPGALFKCMQPLPGSCAHVTCSYGEKGWTGPSAIPVLWQIIGNLVSVIQMDGGA